jgi:YVTN family beta-propeller protein
MARRLINFVVLLCFISCTKDKGLVDHGSGYPREVSDIILSKCAVAGCHNDASKDAAAGLSLATWEKLFEGGRGGPAVIPYRPDFSTLCFYTNTFPELGPLLEPTMPLGRNPLTKEEYSTIQTWVRNGAPDANGKIKFADDPFRSKLYVTNQLCDLVFVIDAETKLSMRCINVGVLSKTEFPVCIKVSPDKKYWYVSFLASNVLQKFNAVIDELVGSVDLGPGTWSTFEISEDSKYAICADNNQPGKIVYVDLERMQVDWTFSHADLIYPRGVVINNTAKKIYVGHEFGNYLSVINFSMHTSPVLKQVILDGSPPINSNTSNDPISLISHNNRCYIACRGSRDIKILNMENDSLLSSVSLNTSPTFMDEGRGLLFVSCNDDSTSFPGNVGSVKVISLSGNQVIKTINSGYQPNGISVDAKRGYVAVVNSNISLMGPGPHHINGCGGRNGNISFIDLATLTIIPGKNYELAVYPYGVGRR